MRHIKLFSPRQESETLLPEPAVLGYLVYYTRDDVFCQVFLKIFLSFFRGRDFRPLFSLKTVMDSPISSLTIYRGRAPRMRMGASGVERHSMRQVLLP